MATATPPITERQHWLALAHQLADVAARHTLKHFRKPVAVTNKAVGGFDPVTVADVAAEKAMRAMLKRAVPEHGIAGEELADVAGDGHHTWVLDPIDGTRAFMAGLPVWGTLIGLVVDGNPVVGVMDQPFTGERFSGDGVRAMLDHGGKRTRLRTRDTRRLNEATLMATTPDMFATPSERSSFRRLEQSVRLRRFGADCYAYAMVAAGHVDLVVEAGLKAVDIVPLIPIIEGAGGVVSAWDGGSPLRGGRIIAAANPELHRLARAILA